MKIARAGLAIAILASQPVCSADDGWLHYGRDPGGARFSPLTQIDTDNVHRLEHAWS